MMQRNDYILSALKPEHISQMADIEKLCFSLPWSENALREELNNPYARYVVCTCGDEVVGYVGSRVLYDEVHITNVAVLPDHRRQGLGRAMIKEMIRAAVLADYSFITLEVRESNSPARGLYSSLGFEVIGKRPKYYELPVEDALIMTLFLKKEA